MERLDWIAVDWGTSSLRIWAMARDGSVLARLSADEGMGRIDRDRYEAVLLDHVGDWLPPSGSVPVIVCGMAGSRQGWTEAPYAAVPCVPPTLGQAARVATRDPRLEVSILPGVKQERPADVMRGEETQIAGFIALNPRWDGVVCLPGTHSKWAHVSAGEIVSFQTVLTGELFGLLARNSVLRHSVGAEGWDDAAFLDAVSDALSHPEKFGARLFSLRAEALLHGLDAQVARARLSGLVIGLELAATRPYWLGQQVALIGADGLVSRYDTALSAQGVATIRTDAERMTLEGLKAARSIRKEAAE